MSEGWVVVAFFLLVGLLVVRIVREKREQLASNAHLTLRKGETYFQFGRQRRRA
jgi:hypothetical protein